MKKTKIMIWGYTSQSIVCEMFLLNSDIRDKYDYIGMYDRDENTSGALKHKITMEDMIIKKPEIILAVKSILFSVKKDARENSLMGTIEEISEFITANIVFHRKAVSSGWGYNRWIYSTLKFLKSPVDNIFEIGANYGQDANFIRQCFGVPENKVFCFEANPYIAKGGAKTYPGINIINKAVSNINGKVSLHIVDAEDENSGLSTVLDYEYTKNWRTIEVDCISMESYLNEHSEINSIDVLKIDVEGLNYEVLEGFGTKLGIVKSIQIESEFINYHEKHSFKDIVMFLYSMGFEMVDFTALYRQNDSLWIRRDLLNTVPIY